jgi:protease-4
MGRYGASGGYFVSMGADKVVAQPATLTGSIGVFGGKLATVTMWSKLGINWTRVSAGAHAGMWSQVFPFSPSAEARHGAVLDFVYRDFTEKVAADRDLSKDRIDEVARGRVWTGADALQAGLVDAMGGFAVATDLLREALQLETGAPLDFVILPEPLSPLDRFRAALAGGMPLTQVLATLVHRHRSNALGSVLRDLEPVIGDASLLVPPAGMLQLPPFRIVQ